MRITASTVPERLRVLALPDVLVRRCDQHVSWTANAQALPGSYSFAIPWNIRATTVYNGVTMDGGIISLWRPGAEIYSTSGGCDFLYITVPVPLIEQQLLLLRGWALPKHDTIFSLSGTEAVRSITQLVDHMIEVLKDDPDPSGELLQNMQRTLVTQLVMALSPRAWDHSKGHQDIFTRALRFVREHLHEPIYMAELCRTSGAGERLLREVFKEFTTLPPIPFLNYLRLQHAHRLLLEGDPVSMTVKYAALDSGFWDLGRFSTRYKSVFGESPSDTLARSARRA